MRLANIRLVTLCLLAVECAPPPEESASQDDGDDGSGQVTAVGADAEPESGVGPSGEAAPPVDQPMAVDVGNPTDTGPTPTRPRGQIAVADGAPTDGGGALTLTVVGLRLEGSEEAVERSLPPLRTNLMSYRDGARLVLFDGELITGPLTALVLRLDAQEGVSFRDATGTEHPVYVPPLPDGRVALSAALTSPIALGEGSDLTMHVDLRYALRPVDAEATTRFGDAVAGYAYWLVPQQKVFATPAVGHLVLLGLGGTLAKVACAYPGTLGLGTNGDDRCYDAEASATARNGTFFLGFLPPGAYKVRLFVTTTTYVDVPEPLSVTAGATTTLDLNGFASLLPLGP